MSVDTRGAAAYRPDVLGLRVGDRLRAAGGAFVSNARNPNLRRAQLSFGALRTSTWTVTVVLSVYAFRVGGPAAVGLVLFLRTAPGAVLAPLVAPLSDRWPRQRTLVLVSAVCGVATALATLMVALGSPPGVYVFAVVATSAATLYRPVSSALLPSLSQTPLELTSANAVRGLFDSLATLLGPLLAALILASTDIRVAFAVAAGCALWSAVLVLRVHGPAPPKRASRERDEIWTQLLGGLRAVLASRDLALLGGLSAAQTFTRGALSVFAVVVAIQLLHIGEAGAGYLTAAVGAGAVIGSLATASLIGTHRLAGWFGVGVALWGLPILLIGVFPSEAGAFGLLAAVGVANAIVDISFYTLTARLASDEVMGRVFVLLESVVTASVAVGSVVASSVIGVAGLRNALIAIGALCPLAVILGRRRLHRLDATMVVRDSDINLLRGVGMLRPLTLPALEALANGLESEEVAAGGLVFDQGDVGDRYYVVEDGAAELLGDGQVIGTLGRGEGFGEIALLRRVPRTATVRARTAMRLKSLSAAHFIAVITGYASSHDHLNAEIDTKLERFAPAPIPPPEPENGG